MAILLSAATSKFEDGEDYPPATPFKLIIKSNGRDVGFIEGFKIDRLAAEATGDFHLAVEHFSQGVYDFAKALFEQRSGDLRSKFYTGRPYQRGTGSFGQEVDGVDFIFIEELVVHAETDRQQGIGTAALMKFHELYRSRYPFIFTWPAILAGYQTEISRREQMDLVVKFYQRSGYRRVGNTEYFAFAQDADHASRRLLADSDAAGEPQSLRSPAEMSAAFPLHCKVIQTDPKLFDIIRDIDISQIRLPDDYGQTPLHYAANGGRFFVAMSILERSTEELFLQNAYGQTPLEAVEDTIAEVEENLEEEMPDHKTLRNLGKDKLLLKISSKPLALVLREFMNYILDSKKKGLAADTIQGHIGARISSEKEGFLQRMKAAKYGRE